MLERHLNEVVVRRRAPCRTRHHAKHKELVEGMQRLYCVGLDDEACFVRAAASNLCFRSHEPVGTSEGHWALMEWAFF